AQANVRACPRVPTGPRRSGSQAYRQSACARPSGAVTERARSTEAWPAARIQRVQIEVDPRRAFGLCFWCAISRRTPLSESDNVIHVAFGEGGGRIEPKREVGVAPEPARAEPRHDPLTDLYSASDVARLFHVAASRLRYWDRTGFLSPTG